MAPEGTDFDNPMQRSRVRYDETEQKVTYLSALCVAFFLKKNGVVVISVFCVSECQKWQRRFFILYEDGSLRFALDEQVRNCDRKTHFEL